MIQTMLSFLLMVLLPTSYVCDCNATFAQIGASVDMQCDGGCLGTDSCELFGFNLANGDLVVTCACNPNAGAGDPGFYSCGGRDCENGYRYTLVGWAYVPVAPWCGTVDCANSCTALKVPVGVYGPVCTCP